ncbi:MAG: S1C family serine protease [Nitrospinota bacterium]
MGTHLGFLSGPAASLVHLHCAVPDEHPSAAILGTERSGTGVIVEEGGYILTVGYVVMGASELSAGSAGGETCDARIVHVDFESGLAVVRAEELADPPVEMKPAADLELATPVVLLASNGEDQFRGSEGFVSDLGPFDAHWEHMLESAIKATAVNPGLGGGALITLDGVVRGIVSLNLHLIGTCSLSIPIDLFLAQRDVFLGRKRADNHVHRPWLGVYSQPLEKGVLVAGVAPGGPAENSGIVAGDIVLYINGEEVSSRRAFYEKLWEGRAGDIITLTIYREKRFRTVHVASRSRADFYK